MMLPPGAPGSNLTGRNRYAQLLQGMPDSNNGTTLGGLGSVLQKALLGMAMGDERRQADSGQQTLAQALQAMQGQPAENIAWNQPARPDGTGAPTTEIAPAVAPNRNLAMQLLSSNPQTAAMGWQMAMSDAEMQQERAARRSDAEYAQGLKNRAPLEQARIIANSLGLTEGTPEYDAFVREKVLSGEAGAPSAVREYEFFSKLPPQEQQRFLVMKRANPYLNLGDVYGQMDPLRPGQMLGSVGVGTAPETKIQDDRIVVAPATPGGPGRGQPQAWMPPPMQGAPMQPQAPAGVAGGVPPQGAPPMPQQQPMAPQAVPQVPGGVGITNLPPSPEQARDAQKDADQTASRDAVKKRAADVVLEDIDRAITKMDTATFPTAGMAGEALSRFGGSSAYDVRALIDTVKGNIGFDRLQQMRDSSPTGGALGAINAIELQTLQAVLGNLQQAQSEEQLRYNLQRMKNLYLDIIHGPGNRPDAAQPAPAAAPAPGGGAGGGWSIQRVD